MSGNGQVFYKIEIPRQDVNHIIHIMNQVKGSSAESVLSKAATATAREVKRTLTNRAKEVYEAPRVNSINERSKVKKANVNKVVAEIQFRSDLPGITKFKAPKKETKTSFTKSEKKVRVLKIKNYKGTGQEKTIFRWLGKPRMHDIWVSQRKDSRLQRIMNGFVTRFKTGHLAVAYRNESARKGGTRIREVLGSTDRAMIRNEDVYGKEEGNITSLFLENCEKMLDEALMKLGGK